MTLTYTCPCRTTVQSRSCCRNVDRALEDPGDAEIPNPDLTKGTASSDGLFFSLAGAVHFMA